MGLNCLCAAAASLFCAAVLGADTHSMRTIAKQAFSGIQEECRLVVTNQAAWDALWKRHNLLVEPKDPAPTVDFTKETVLAVAMGQKRSGGYSTEILKVEPSGGKTVVTYRNKSPKPGGLTIQALTAPVHIAAVPKITGEVQFQAVE